MCRKMGQTRSKSFSGVQKSHSPFRSIVQRRLYEDLNKLENKSIKFGISGMTNTGKSTFINSIRGLKEGDVGLAEVGRGNTTTSPTSYFHSENKKLEFVDLPGVGTIKFPKKNYIEKMHIREYDYFLIFFDTVLQEDDVWLACELSKLNKGFTLVRSEVDKDVKIGMKRGLSEETVLDRLRDQVNSAKRSQKYLKDCIDIFFISSKKPWMGEMDNLHKHIMEKLQLINEEKKYHCVSSWSFVEKFATLLYLMDKH